MFLSLEKEHPMQIWVRIGPIVWSASVTDRETERTFACTVVSFYQKNLVSNYFSAYPLPFSIAWFLFYPLLEGLGEVTGVDVADCLTPPGLGCFPVVTNADKVILGLGEQEVGGGQVR